MRQRTEKCFPLKFLLAKVTGDHRTAKANSYFSVSMSPDFSMHLTLLTVASRFSCSCPQVSITLSEFSFLVILCVSDHRCLFSPFKVSSSFRHLNVNVLSRTVKGLRCRPTRTVTYFYMHEYQRNTRNWDQGRELFIITTRWTVSTATSGPHTQTFG